MSVMINGIKVKYPNKLECRKDEIVELVDMVKELNEKEDKVVTRIHVWANRRQELCYADFTERKYKSEGELDLVMAERGETLEAIEMSMRVLEIEKQCVTRQYKGMCDNKRDCEHCDLVLEKEDILLGYSRALKCMRHLRDTIADLV